MSNNKKIKHIDIILCENIGLFDLYVQQYTCKQIQYIEDITFFETLLNKTCYSILSPIKKDTLYLCTNNNDTSFIELLFKDNYSMYNKLQDLLKSYNSIFIQCFNKIDNRTSLYKNNKSYYTELKLPKDSSVLYNKYYSNIINAKQFDVLYKKTFGNISAINNILFLYKYSNNIDFNTFVDIVTPNLHDNNVYIYDFINALINKENIDVVCNYLNMIEKQYDNIIPTMYIVTLLTGTIKAYVEYCTTKNKAIYWRVKDILNANYDYVISLLQQLYKLDCSIKYKFNIDSMNAIKYLIAQLYY